MACIKSFTPTGIDIVEHPSGEAVALRFEDGADYVEVAFPRLGLPELFDHILRAVRVERPTPIESHALQEGGVVSLQGHDVRQLEGGNVLLTIHLRTDEGMRTMPWTMTSEAARLIAGQLIEHAK